MIVVGSTTVSWKCNGTELSWLNSAEALKSDAPDGATFFASLEVDGRGKAPFARLIDRIDSLGGETWTYSFDDGATEINTHNRIPRICMGRNIIIDFAVRLGASHILFLDTDLQVPGDSISKLLELDFPIVAGDMPNYLYADKVDAPQISADPPVFEHWSPAGFLMVSRELFRQIRWRNDAESGMTDDPCFALDAQRLGFNTRVRKDIWSEHRDVLIPVEQRDDDRRVRPLNF